MIRTALLLAAGRGERLRPLTDKHPKPLCKVGGLTLIERLIQQLAQAGITKLVINHAYLGSQIRHHLKEINTGHLSIVFSPEPPGALETGGAIVQALPLLGTDPFVALSTDIVTDYPFSTLHLRENHPVHLVLVPKQPHTPKGDFGLDKQQHVLLNPTPYTYGNIACIDPAVFKNQPRQRFRLPDFLRPLIQTDKVSGEYYEGQWMDTGSMARLNQANALFSPRHCER